MPLTLRENISYPKQELLSECRSVSSSADVPVNPCSLEVRVRNGLSLLAERLENEWPFRIVSNFCADVLDPPLPFRSEKVETETVLRGIGFRHKTRPKDHPLGCIHDAFKNRILHPLAVIFAQSGHSAQSATTGFIASAHIVTDKDHHDVLGYLQKNAGYASSPPRT